MISSRFTMRSARQAVSRFSTSALRRPAPFSQLSCQALRLPSSPPSVVAISCRLPTLRAAFSGSVRLRATAGESDTELIAKLAAEVEMEREMKGDDVMPTSIKDFMDNSPFKVIDTPGSEEVVLERKFGEETIRVSFSTSDVNAMDHDSDYTDRALGDEMNDSNDDLSAGVKAAAESAESEDVDSQNGEEGEGSFPSQLNITIEKPGKGALVVDATAQDGTIIIDSIYYYKSTEHALARSADTTFERENIYAGPPFGNLDEDLQVLMERYLDERGINSALAVFVPDYMDLKEQREYEAWLGNVKGFLEG